jgi:uncharacterized protein GlcG (DUF336 family)
MKLDLTNASVIVDAALENARKAKIRPLCVAVLDDGGNLKALKRDDGASILRPQIAMKELPAFLNALSSMTGGKVVPVAGGVLIMDGEVILGAAGASGATADEDEACVIAGIQAAGLQFKV